MKINKLFIAIVFMLSACTEKTETVFNLPDVNEENCKTENILKLSDRQAIEKMSSLCSHQVSERPAPPKADWNRL